MSDNVNQPKHYKQHKYECIDEMVIVFGKEAVINFCICNAWKYRNRAPYKGNADEDYAKSDWYLQKANELQGLNIPTQEEKETKKVIINRVMKPNDIPTELYTKSTNDFTKTLGDTMEGCFG